MDRFSLRRTGGRAAFLRCFLTITVVVLAACDCTLVTDRHHELTVLSYNVENLFDDVYDGTEYQEYDPRYGWSNRGYHAKLKNVARVIADSPSGGADIVALQEIENRKTLEDLVEGYLRFEKYRDIVVVPTANAAVNVGILSRLPVTGVRTHTVHAEYPARYILEVRVRWSGHDIVVFVNHWKSKYGGGAYATEPLRIAHARVLEERIARLARREPRTAIVVAGDLNVSIDEFDRRAHAYPTALVPIGGPSAGGLFVTHDTSEVSVAGERAVLFSPWHLADHPGSYEYDGVWKTIDHFLLCPVVIDPIGVKFAEFEVVVHDYLVTQTGRPYRWNPRSMTGYSDHLPILLRLKR